MFTALYISVSFLAALLALTAQHLEECMTYMTAWFGSADTRWKTGAMRLGNMGREIEKRWHGRHDQRHF